MSAVVEALQESAKILYGRYPIPVVLYFAIMALGLTVWAGHALLMLPSRKPQTSESASINFQGNHIQQLNVYNAAPPAATAPAPPPSTVVGPAIVENGGFEQGTDGWGTGFFESLFAVQEGRPLSFNNAVAKWEIDDQKSHSGRRSLRVGHSTPYNSHVFSSFSQRIKVIPNRKYEVRYWVYVEALDGSGGFSLRAVPSRTHALTEWDKFRGKVIPSIRNQWQEVRFEFDSGGESSFDLRFAAETNLKLWVDDVSVTLLDGSGATGPRK